MVDVAQGDGVLIRHLEPEGAALGKAQVVRVRWLAPANEAGLVGDEGEVRLIANALFFGEGELRGLLVDGPRRC